MARVKLENQSDVPNIDRVSERNMAALLVHFSQVCLFRVSIENNAFGHSDNEFGHFFLITLLNSCRT